MRKEKKSKIIERWREKNDKTTRILAETDKTRSYIRKH